MSNMNTAQTKKSIHWSHSSYREAYILNLTWREEYILGKSVLLKLRIQMNRCPFRKQKLLYQCFVPISSSNTMLRNTRPFTEFLDVMRHATNNLVVCRDSRTVCGCCIPQTNVPSGHQTLIFKLHLHKKWSHQKDCTLLWLLPTRMNQNHAAFLLLIWKVLPSLQVIRPPAPASAENVS